MGEVRNSRKKCGLI